MGSQEMLNIKAGYGITLAFDNNLNQVELETNLAAEIAAAETGAITALRDGVTADGNTLAKLRGLIAAIETALGVDDVSLDTLQEVISAIRTDQGLIDSLTSSKVNVNDIVDGLTSTETTKPLSANQGRSLKLMLDNVLAQTWIIATSPKRITQDMLLLAEQNGLSIGPIAVAQNINVTVQPNSTWRII
jgi:Ca2+-binding RTX toxin-like protein